MNKEAKKIVGWVLIVLALILILLVMIKTYKIFTGTSQAPKIFKTDEVKNQQDLANRNGDPQTPEAQQLQKTILDQIKNILPAEQTSQMLNLSSWLIFVGIIIYGSGKIGGIGVSLLKE